MIRTELIADCWRIEWRQKTELKCNKRCSFCAIHHDFFGKLVPKWLLIKCLANLARECTTSQTGLLEFRQDRLGVDFFHFISSWWAFANNCTEAKKSANGSKSHKKTFNQLKNLSEPTLVEWVSIWVSPRDSESELLCVSRCLTVHDASNLKRNQE